MKLLSFFKKMSPVFLMTALVFSVLNFGSYDTTNEVMSVFPNSVLAATDSSFSLALSSLQLESSTFTSVESNSPTTATSSEASSTSSHSSVSEQNFVGSCNLTANTSQVFVGSSVTLGWSAEGFSTLTLNGQELTGKNGQKTFHNLQEDTSYTLIAKTADGKSSCVSTIKIVCLPKPPVPPTCKQLGYDFDIVKYEWEGGSYKKESNEKHGYVISVSGNDKKATWTSNKEVAEVIAKASTNYGKFAGGTAGEVNKCDIGSGCHGISFVQFCGKELPPEPPVVEEKVPMCLTFTANPFTLPHGGGQSELKWTTKDASKVVINNGIGEVGPNGTRKVNVTETTTYTLTTSDKNKEHSCFVTVEVEPKPILPTCDMFSVTPDTIVRGHSAELVWKTSNATRVTINNGIGEVDLIGKTSITPLANIFYTLTAFGEKGERATCKAKITVNEPPKEKVPMCLTFTANPFTLPHGGGQSELKWTTKDASKVVINNGIGEIGSNGTRKVNVTETTTYTLTTSDKNKEHSCYVTIDVESYVPPVIPAPVCTLTPANKTITSGQSVDLTWTTTNASSTTLTSFGNVDLNGTKNTGPLTSNTNYTLNVLGLNGQTISCNSEVKVTTAPSTPDPITCENNVNLSVSPSGITRGNSSTLTWATTDITGVSLNQNIGTTTLSGNLSVSPTSNTTYTLTATDGKDTIHCPISVTVNEPPTTTTGGGGRGGGGGSILPTCELSLSKTKIKSGEEIDLVWSSRRAHDVVIEDSRDKTLVTTKNLLDSAKERLFSGSMKVSPTRDTEYTITVERSGSRDRVCTVDVEVEQDTVVVTQVRDQQPLIAGIALSEVPYTGFEAGPILTTLFYLILMLWALYIAYFVAVRRDVVGGYKLVTPDGDVNQENSITKISEKIRPDVFVSSVKAPETGPLLKEINSAPLNLPVGNPIIGYSSTDVDGTMQVSGAESQITDEVVTQLENFAHTQHVLLSSDAIRHFMSTTKGIGDRQSAFQQVVKAAKAQFPSEDGWIVINEERMRNLCVICADKEMTSSSQPYVPTVIPEGSGSLAEAIVTGNVVAAYELLGQRPMFALADATADLDSVYRLRKGKDEVVSDMLIKETANLTDEQLLKIIQALTSALDGTYNDEVSAVKMAVMKAIKVVV